MHREFTFFIGELDHKRPMDYPHFDMGDGSHVVEEESFVTANEYFDADTFPVYPPQAIDVSDHTHSSSVSLPTQDTILLQGPLLMRMTEESMSKMHIKSRHWRLYHAILKRTNLLLYPNDRDHPIVITLDSRISDFCILNGTIAIKSIKLSSRAKKRVRQGQALEDVNEFILNERTNTTYFLLAKTAVEMDEWFSLLIHLLNGRILQVEDQRQLIEMPAFYPPFTHVDIYLPEIHLKVRVLLMIIDG
jgi:hypothetical protein